MMPNHLVAGALALGAPAWASHWLSRGVTGPLSPSALLEGANTGAICAAHVRWADEQASNLKTKEQRGRPANAAPRWVIMVEGAAPEAIENGCESHLSPAGFENWAAQNLSR